MSLLRVKTSADSGGFWFTVFINLQISLFMYSPFENALNKEVKRILHKVCFTNIIAESCQMSMSVVYLHLLVDLYQQFY